MSTSTPAVSPVRARRGRRGRRPDFPDTARRWAGRRSAPTSWTDLGHSGGTVPDSHRVPLLRRCRWWHRAARGPAVVGAW